MRLVPFPDAPDGNECGARPRSEAILRLHRSTSARHGPGPGGHLPRPRDTVRVPNRAACRFASRPPLPSRRPRRLAGAGDRAAWRRGIPGAGPLQSARAERARGPDRVPENAVARQLFDPTPVRSVEAREEASTGGIRLRPRPSISPPTTGQHLEAVPDSSSGGAHNTAILGARSSIRDRSRLLDVDPSFRAPERAGDWPLLYFRY